MAGDKGKRRYEFAGCRRGVLNEAGSIELWKKFAGVHGGLGGITGTRLGLTYPRAAC